MAILKAGIVQQSCSSDREANIRKSLEGIAQCAAQGAQIVILQELHTGIYFCQAEDTTMFDLAEPLPGQTYEQFSAVA